MSIFIWKKCLIRLKNELSITEFSMWIRPLKAKLSNNTLKLYAPNQFVLDWIKDRYTHHFKHLLYEFRDNKPLKLQLYINKKKVNQPINKLIKTIPENRKMFILRKKEFNLKKTNNYSNISIKYKFENFIEGKSNQLAKSAAYEVSKNLGRFYNPLFLYGRTGLGKTHLLHAIGNVIINNKKNCKIIYIHSEKFVQDMVQALHNNTIEIFKKYYRSADALLIDDIHFFANKERSQEELFHTFNSLLERGQQIVLTSDRYPEEINGVENRLKSRFYWGLTVSINPPEFDTRVAILMKKADDNNIILPDEVAFFIAKKLKTNVRELEGALNKVIANANFTRHTITIDFVRETLRDLLALQNRLITIINIQQLVAEYYKIKISDLLSKSRARTIARPRQIAMAISKELTNHSLPEIGNAFGGRDHTTVLHACKKVENLKEENRNIKEDFSHLVRKLSS